MTRPAAYDPQPNQRYQILARGPDARAWDHCDYAADDIERRYLIKEYSRAYGNAWRFKTIRLPKKYHPKRP